MSDPRELAAHLALYERLGVSGISRDRAWRERENPKVGEVLPDLPKVDEVLADRVTQNDVDNPSVTPLNTDPASALAAIRADIGNCTRCPLHTQGRKQIVFGVGNPSAELMFVGEAPGADEDEQGEPFVGRAGQLLTKIIEAIDLKRNDVYIANVIKCRPPGNRNPEPVEVATCSPFLLQQIDTIRPKVIVALGTFSAQMLLQTDTPISRLRGRAHPFRGGIKVVPTFHPAYLLRSPDKKREVWEDMKFVRGLLADSD
jgi:uracil-DNA glycosylase